MSEPYLAEIRIFGFNFPPRDWAQCDGQLLSIAQNTALFSLLGTTYGGDGRTTFGLPDFRARAVAHVGNGPGLSNYAWGQKGGTDQGILSVDQMPAHTHTFEVSADALEIDTSEIDENGSVVLSGSFVDPGTLDDHVITIDWGDGSSDSLTLAAGVASFSGGQTVKNVFVSWTMED